MCENEWEDGDDPAIRKKFGYMLRSHVAYQDGRYSEAPTLVFSDADYEVGDGTCGLHADGKSANEPVIVYVRADALMHLEAENRALRVDLSRSTPAEAARVEEGMAMTGAVAECIKDLERAGFHEAAEFVGTKTLPETVAIARAIEKGGDDG